MLEKPEICQIQCKIETPFNITNIVAATNLPDNELLFTVEYVVLDSALCFESCLEQKRHFGGWFNRKS